MVMDLKTLWDLKTGLHQNQKELKFLHEEFRTLQTEEGDWKNNQAHKKGKEILNKIDELKKLIKSAKKEVLKAEKAFEASNK